MKSSFQFTNPILTNLDFRLNKHFFDVQKRQGVELGTSMKGKVEDYHFADGHTTVSLKITISEASEPVPFSLKAKISAEFKWNTEELDDETVAKMLSVNAPALLLGYIRPIVAQITMQSGLPAYHIPFIDFTKIKLPK